MTKWVNEFMHYIRIAMFSAKAPNGTLLRFIISLTTIKQQWLILDHWACPLNNSQKGSSGFKKKQVKKKNKIIKKSLWPPFMYGVQLLQNYSHLEEAVYFIKLSPQKYLELILSTSKGWKAESTLEPPNGIYHETPGLGIQHLNH